MRFWANPGINPSWEPLSLEELELEIDPTRGALRPMQEFLLLAVG